MVGSWWTAAAIKSVPWRNGAKVAAILEEGLWLTIGGRDCITWSRPDHWWIRHMNEFSVKLSMDRSAQRAARYALRVLGMVLEFHKSGFQRLRIFPSLSPSGTCWRCAITPASNILRSHGAMIKDRATLAVEYTTGDGHEYFGWRDTRLAKAPELASRFTESFPSIVRAARGSDWNYAGWYVEVLGRAELGELPVAMADWPEFPDHPCFLPTTKGIESTLPMPPGGEAEDQE